MATVRVTSELADQVPHLPHMSAQAGAPHELWRLLAAHVEFLRESVADANVESVRFRIKHDIALDYQRESSAFAVAFLGSNYWKTSAALEVAHPASLRRIVDLGSGSGAAGLAALAYATACGVEGDVEIVFVDASDNQLVASKAALEAVMPALGSLRVHDAYVREDVTKWACDHQRWADLVLASHLLAESPGTAADVTRHALRSVRPDGMLLIVERADDNVVCAQAAAAASQSALPFNRHVGSVKVPGEDDRGPRGLQWIAIGQPSVSWLPELVVRYFEAWNKSDPDLLQEVFTSDAAYSEKPTEQPLHGLDGIRKYWQNEVRPQEFIDAQPKATAYYGYRSIIEWQSTFHKKGLDYQVDGSMVLDADPALKRIASLREIFRVSKYSPAGSESRSGVRKTARCETD